MSLKITVMHNQKSSLLNSSYKKIINDAYTGQTPLRVQNLSSGQRFISLTSETKFVNGVSEVA